MLRMRTGILPLLLSPLAATSSPEILPSFDAAHCAWRATHVVIAHEGKTIDGTVRVERSLMGDLRAGRQIELPDLARFAKDEERRVHDWTGKPPRAIDGRKLLLFLRKGAAGWTGAGWGDRLDISLVWLEGDGGYCRSQVINPGPLVVTRLHRSVADLIADSLHIGSDRVELDRALENASPLARARTIRSLLEASAEASREHLVRALMTECNGRGHRVLEGMLAAEQHLHLHPLLILALGRHHAEGAARLVPDLLRRELAFWKTAKFTRHELGRAAPRHDERTYHYQRLHAVLRVVGRSGHGIDEPALREVLRHWDERPDIDEWLRYTVGRTLAVESAKLAR